MTSLRDRATAAAAAGTDRVPRPTDNSTDETWAPAGDPLEPVEYTGPIVDAEQVPVHIAWARVMADVQLIPKGDRREDRGGQYNFRGVDRVITAVGPALRRHGVLLMPVKVSNVTYRDQTTKAGNVMQECTLTVDWQVIGPMGDLLPVVLQSVGQANDTGDKATAKAMSIAHRVLFLTSLHIPTGDPNVDVGDDRGEARFDPVAYRDEALNPATSPGRISQMVNDLKRLGQGHVLVLNEEDKEEKLGNLLWRIGTARKAATVAPAAPDSGGDGGE
jgi:ERF superfamily protein